MGKIIVHCSVCGADITQLLKFYDGVVGHKEVYCYSCWQKHKEEIKRKKAQQKTKIEEEIREYARRRRKKNDNH